MGTRGRRKTTCRFWNNWPQHDENAAGKRRITRPSLYDTSTSASRKHVLCFPSWDLLHRVSWGWGWRSFPCLYVTDLLICESCHAQNWNHNSQELHHIYGTVDSGNTRDLWYEVWRSEKCNTTAVLGSTPHSHKKFLCIKQRCLQIHPLALPSGPKLRGWMMANLITLTFDSWRR